MQISRLVAPVAALVLAVSGCVSGDGGDGPAGTSSPSGAGASTSSAPPSEPTEGASPSNQASPASGLSRGAQAVVDAFVKANEGATELPADQLDPEAATKSLEKIQVSPQECKDAALSAQDPEVLRDAVLGGAFAQDAETGNSTVLSVAEFKDASVKQHMRTGRGNAGQCPKLELEMGGQKATTVLKVLDAPSVEGMDDAYVLSSTTTSQGQTHEAFTGVAGRGKVMITIAVTTLDGSRDAKDVDRLLAESAKALG